MNAAARAFASARAESPGRVGDDLMSPSRATTAGSITDCRAVTVPEVVVPSSGTLVVFRASESSMRDERGVASGDG